MDGQLEPIRIFAALHACGVRSVLVGGMAAFAHGGDAATDDVDVCVEATEVNLDRLAKALEQLGARPVEREGEAQGRESFLTHGGPLDCIELEPERFDPLYERGVDVLLGRGVTTRVASVRSLAESKREEGDLSGTVRISSLGGDPDALTVRSESDELAIVDDGGGGRPRDRVWRALEGVDRFLTRLVDR